jgi:hypothetical protein
LKSAREADVARGEFHEQARVRFRECAAVGTPARKEPVPDLPERPGGWLQGTREWWRRIWESPMATEWLGADHDTVLRLAYMVDADARGEGGTVLRRGNSSVSGTFHGKHQVLEMWGSLGEEFSVEPEIMTADDTHVVVISTNAVGGDKWKAADVFTFEGDKVKSYVASRIPFTWSGPFPRAEPPSTNPSAASGVRWSSVKGRTALRGSRNASAPTR